ncbi:M23 family metallopeptidase [Nocardioides bruguierae]|uniref:M23 family metallopeptidase n=1 Tax=Nocardioides bruguierae TaxID=2945102 RepID=A0A9X2IG63_9ACTN|nr:M23 family metallopeptidase [Nocardioides bruguierae]MCM0621234.1 M23 family metallopeptidase [Nocardioides bruguierae]
MAPAPQEAARSYVGRRRMVQDTPATSPAALPVVRSEVALLEVDAATVPATAPTTQEIAAIVDGPAPATSVDTGTGTSSLDTGVIAAVLADLEPRDHSTSFAAEETEVLPLLRAAEPGRRRAARGRKPRTRLPGVPLVAGLATLAVTVGGVVWSGQSDVVPDTSAPDSVTALVGNTGTVVGNDRDVVSRSTDRAATSLGEAVGLTDADADATTDEDSEAVTEAAAERAEALQSIDDQASERSEDLANMWILPVSGYRLTARFGEYGLWASYHTGLDFAADAGTPIYAVASGTVTFAGYDGAYGYKTVVTLEDGTEIWYAHQTTQYVTVGQVVTAGDTIGTIGSTGNVTGPHLHLEVRPGGGDPVDPYAALVEHGITP